MKDVGPSIQSGERSLNVGQGDFRGATIHVGDNRGAQQFSSEQLGIERTVLLKRSLARRTAMEAFATVSGLASILGLYFTFFSPFGIKVPSSWFGALFFTLVVAVSFGLVSFVLKRQRFCRLDPFALCLELGKRDGVYLTMLRAACPWCGSRMLLRSVGPKNSRESAFVCERNPRQHRALLDPTALPEIGE